jgi:anti-sigma B factor antagonist
MTLPLEHGAHDGGYLVAVSGELDLASVPELRAALEIAAASGAPVVLDVSGVTFIDSTALGALLRANDELASGGPGMVTICPSGPVRRLLALTRLEDRLTFAPDRESAFARVRDASRAD